VATYFRLHPSDQDAQELLEPENQKSKPWGGADPGPCDKCHQNGKVEYRDGRMDVCPACLGSGEISDTERRGVAVFPDPDSLYGYMIRKDADMAGQKIVQLEGELSDDLDFDADEGALLVRPTRIVAVEKLDEDRIGELEAEVRA